VNGSPESRRQSRRRSPTLLTTTRSYSPVVCMWVAVASTQVERPCPEHLMEPNAAGHEVCHAGLRGRQTPNTRSSTTAARTPLTSAVWHEVTVLMVWRGMLRACRSTHDSLRSRPAEAVCAHPRGLHQVARPRSDSSRAALMVLAAGLDGWPGTLRSPAPCASVP